MYILIRFTSFAKLVIMELIQTLFSIFYAINYMSASIVWELYGFIWNMLTKVWLNLDFLSNWLNRYQNRLEYLSQTIHSFVNLLLLLLNNTYSDKNSNNKVQNIIQNYTEYCYYVSKLNSHNFFSDNTHIYCIRISL